MCFQNIKDIFQLQYEITFTPLHFFEFGVRIELTTLVLQTSTHPLCIPNDRKQKSRLLHL